MTNGIRSGTNGITRGTNGDSLLECPHCGSVAEYVSEHANGRRWAAACTMTSKVAADEGRPMCRCRTPFFRDKGQARDVWNRRAAITDRDFAMAVHDGELWGKCSECKERQGYYRDAETIRNQQEHIAELERQLEAREVVDWWTDEHGDTHAIAANGQEVCHYVRGEHAEAVNRALAERDELIRDLLREAWVVRHDDPFYAGYRELGQRPTFEQRARELGIEVGE